MSRAELLRALAVLCEPPAPEHAAIAEALGIIERPLAEQHTDLFCFQLYPYASVYLSSEGMLGGETADRVAGFWRALRLAPAAEPDHLVALLGLYGGMVAAEQQEDEPARRLLKAQARRALLWEHLLAWLPAYLVKAMDIAPPFYRSWARLLMKALLAEAEEVDAPQGSLLHLREAPAIAPPEDEPGALVRSLLAPVRSGMILTRVDLARAAGSLGLGLRLGERAFVLAAMLDQDARATLAWVSSEARTWATLHRDLEPALGPVARHWRGRAEAVARMLEAGADEGAVARALGG